MKLMIDNLLEIKCMLASTKPVIIVAVISALEDSAVQAGQVAYDKLKDLLDQSESRLIALVQKHSGNGSNGKSQKETQITVPWTWLNENISEANKPIFIPGSIL